MRKSLIVLGAALFAVCSVMTPVWAKDRVEVKVTSEPIPLVSQCSKAGDLSLEFDTDTELVNGHTITVDLPLLATGEAVTLCKDIDFVVAQANTVSFTTAAGWTVPAGAAWDATTPDQNGNESPFEYVTTAPTANVGVVFHVKGTKGTSRVTIDVVGNDGTVESIVVGPGADDRLRLNLFDLRDNTNFTTAGIWEDVDGDGTYDDALDGDDNAFCIDVFNDDGTTFDDRDVFLANIDSNVYTFIPSNPQVAHIAGSESYNRLDCKDTAVATIPVPSDEQGSTATCTFKSTSNKLVIDTPAGSFSTSEQYGIRLEIASPVEAYWAGASATTAPTINWQRMSASEDCDDAGTAVSGTLTTVTARDAAGNTVTAFEMGATCPADVSAAEDAKILEAADGITFTSSRKERLYIDIPQMVFAAGISNGDDVQVKVTLLKVPCGEVEIGTFTLATFGTSTTSNSLTFPYFTNMADGDGWWDGIVITNMSSTDGTATITVYEADGDMGTMEVSVASQSQYVNVLSAMVDSFTADASNTGTLGDSSSYIMVSTDFSADGFAMMGEGTQAQGYLPRK